MKSLILAEKPSVGKDIAQALHSINNVKVTSRIKNISLRGRWDIL